ncbi:MAG: error-prone DNA polymerase [Fuerstiella sp.]
MPEQPAYQRPERIPATATAPSQHPVLPYAELHSKTNFSFLEGASHADELVAEACRLGHTAIAVTDRNTLAGVVRAHVAAKEAGLKLLVGAEIVPVDAPAVVLLCTDRTSYGRLSELITVGRRRAAKGECRIRQQDVAELSDGLIACVPLSTESQLRFNSEFQPGQPCCITVEQLQVWKQIFGDRCYALAELHHGPDDAVLLQQFTQIAAQAAVPLAAANDVHFHDADRRPLHDVVTAIRNGQPLEQLGHELHPNGERHLKSAEQLLQQFGGQADLIERTQQIADQCHFSLDELRYEYPEELVPDGYSPSEYLDHLTWSGARKRYPDGVPDKVRRLLQHELQLIADMQYEAYFLTVYDVVRFARSKGILCQGRGSAANSTVCFCLGVTSVDPDRIDVLFERFISRERDEAPDIDVDFEHERREEVLQYIYERYGRDRAGMTGVVVTYRPKSAVRDVAKALGMSNDRVDKLAAQLEHVDRSAQLPERICEGGIDPTSLLGRRLSKLVTTLLGFPRHLSQHVGGMVMSQGPLSQLVPIENAAMPGRTVIQWDKNDLDALGLLKVDCLALGMLSCIRRCFEFVRKHHQRQLTLANVPAEDQIVYDMISDADTVGVFQIESRAQMSMLPRLRPHCFYDLVIEVAIVRPGPIQGDMVHPYLRRRSGEEPVEFPNQEVRSVLHKTLGVPIFQEQAMRLAIVAAGFTPGEADQLRRAMGAWRKSGVIEQFRQKLISGMKANGYDADFAERVFKQISGFGEYGFPESHAASFALLVYVSCWLKRYHPAVFCAALINSQPMGFYAPAQLVRDARDHGVTMLPIDVNYSHWDCTLEPVEPVEDPSTLKFRHHDESLAVRLGFRLLRGFSQEYADRIQNVRDAGELFSSYEDFVRRTSLSRAALQQLAKADAFASLQVNRRDALWKALPVNDSLPLFDGLEGPTTNEADPHLPQLTAQEDVVADYSSTGLSLKRHPVSFLRSRLEQLKVLSAEQLPSWPADRRVKVAGLVLMRQRPQTAAGVTFVTLEDETGIANLVVYPAVWKRFRPTARFASVLMASGRLQREGDIIHIVCDRLDDVSEMLRELDSRSRDFR